MNQEQTAVIPQAAIQLFDDRVMNRGAACGVPECQCRPGSRPHCRPVTMVADNV